MKRSRAGFWILAMAALALWFPSGVAAQEGANTEMTGFAVAPEPVKVSPTIEQEKGRQVSEDLIKWRNQILDKVNREPGPEWKPPIRFQGQAPAFVPPTGPEGPDKSADQPAADSDFVTVIQHGFTSSENQSVGNVAEPSVAVAQMKKLFMTTNWSAAKSSDHGRNWTYINPYTYFSPPSGFQFCCDQEVVFDPTYNFFIWSMLYTTEDGKGGVIRLACSRNLNSWWYWDFANSTTSLPDYPHIRLSRNFLYLTYNEFAPNFTNSYIYRMPLLDMAMQHGFSYRYVSRNEFNFTIAYTMRSNSTMYAATNSLGNVRVLEWKESSNNYSTHDISVASWSSDLQCPCPDGHDPCGRVGTRILGAVATYNDNFSETCKNQLWLFWNAGKTSGRPYPYVYGVKICMDDWTRISYLDLWNADYAWQYPALAVNPRGDICFTMDMLGGTYYNQHYNAIIDQYSGYEAPLEIHWVASGNACPSDGKWGDYQSAGTWWRNSYQCVSIGHILMSSGPQNWYTRFTRARDQ